MNILKRAVIVDDDLRTCNVVESVLVAAGIDSMKVTTTAEAASAFDHGRFLVAFLGSPVAFPRGLELTRLLRDSTFNRTTPVILLSADPRPRAMSEGFQAGATFFLYKPVDRDRLFRLIRATHGAMENKLLRRTRRVALASKVDLWFRDEEIAGETVNASMEGLLIKITKAVPVGSSVDMRLHLSKDLPPLVASGSVVRVSDKGELGIQLGKMNLRESQRLEDFLLPLIPTA